MQIVDRRHQLAVALVRIGVGVIFLWAGLEKVLGSGPGGFSAAGFLGHGTGGTLGWPFVAAGTEGPFNPTVDFWVGLSTNTSAMQVINFVVPFGQIGIGVSLILGLFTRFGAAMGTLMMLFFFVAAWDFEFGIVNQHLTYAFVTFLLGYLGAGNYFGLDGMLGDRFGHGLRRWIFSGENRPRPEGAVA